MQWLKLKGKYAFSTNFMQDQQKAVVANFETINE